MALCIWGKGKGITKKDAHVIFCEPMSKALDGDISFMYRLYIVSNGNEVGVVYKMLLRSKVLFPVWFLIYL